MFPRIILAIFVIFSFNSVLAQTRCPPGATPGSVQCQPDQSSSSATPQTVIRYTGRWDKTWGAISDGENGVGGVVTGKLTKDDAENGAIAACISRGGQGCKATFSYFNQCVAALGTVKGGGHGFTQSAASEEEAARLGIAACEKRNDGKTCQVVYSACTEPIFHES